MQKLKFIIIGLLLLVWYTNVYYAHRTNPSSDDCAYFGLFVIIQLAYSIYSWWKVDGTLFNAYIVFIIAFYLFNTGQVVLELFGWAQNAHLLLNGYLDSKAFYDGAYYSLGSLLFFHFGALLVAKRKRVLYNTFSDYAIKTRLSFEAIWKAGLSCVIISAPFYFYNLYANVLTAMVYGYSGLVENSENSHLASVIGDMYTPALIALYFSSEFLNKGKKSIVYTLFLTVFLPPLILGGRSNTMIIFAVFCIIYSLYHKIKKRHLLITGIATFALLFLFFVIALTRNISNKSISLYEDALAENKENPIAGVIQEMGFSMFPVSWTMQNVPKRKDYEYGTTYLWELFSIVPNLGFWEVHPAKSHESNSWMQKEAGYSFGLGYSLIAEAYNNFGWFGWIFMVFQGYLYCLVFRFVRKENVKMKPIILICSIVFLWFSIKGVRNSFLGIVRGVFYYMIPLYIIINYYKTYLWKEQRLILNTRKD